MPRYDGLCRGSTLGTPLSRRLPPDGGVRGASSGKCLTTKEGNVATSELDTRRVKAAKNQSLFRDVNERIEEVSKGFGRSMKMIDFVCECGRADCSEAVEMTHGEYESIRRSPTHFAIKAGHEITEVEQVMASNARYIVVSKVGAAAQTAKQLDPRAGKTMPQPRRPG
jgi:hypothetical protein